MENSGVNHKGNNRRRWMGAVATGLAVIVGAVLLSPAPSAPAVTTLDPPAGSLVCDANDWLRPANGDVEALGTPAHAELQQALYIPAHEQRCPQTEGKVLFTETPDQLAIRALRQRQVPSDSEPIGPKLASFIGLDQPLSSADWASVTAGDTVDTTLLYHLPLMIDGFVVVANLPCLPAGAPVLLSPSLLADIYSGRITGWHDDRLVERSPLLRTCDLRVQPSIRWGGAWSTAVLKDYMSHADPAFHLLKQREHLDDWPSNLFVNCWGRSEAEMVACASRPGGISYMRYATAKAHGLTPLLLTNSSNWTSPPAANAADAWPSNCLNAPLDATTEPRTSSTAGFALDWSTYSMTYRTDFDGYPLCGFGYIVSLMEGDRGTHQMQRDAWHDHFKLMWSDSSQEALKQHGYAPLPRFVLDRLRQTPFFTECVFTTVGWGCPPIST